MAISWPLSVASAAKPNRAMPATWPCPGPAGLLDEAAVAFDRGRAARLLIVPPLFEEMNRTRRFLAEAQRALDAAGTR